MAFAKVRAESAQLERAAEILRTRLRERGVESGQGYEIRLVLDPSLAENAFRLQPGEIAAADLLGAVHGCGRFLQGCEFPENGFVPNEERVEIAPYAPYRGVYMASHFHNYFHMASIAEMKRYMEDMALWGWKWIMLNWPSIDFENAADPDIAVQTQRHRAVYTAAHELGMKVCIGISVNGGFKDFPKELHAAKHNDPFVRRGDTGNVLCMSKPGAQEYVDSINEDHCRRFQDIGVDMVDVWPYDEGGCGCPECAPWGAKGYIRSSKRAFSIAKKYFPHALRLVSTWCFDTPYEGEWEALDRSLEEEKWCDVILADAHEDYPRYPLDVHVPGGLPLITFPEISMRGLFPWGGWGATMLPDRLSRLYRQLEGKAKGCFLYSEGIYEDFNKAVESQFYLRNAVDWRETARAYGRYELGIADLDAYIRLIELVEKTHTAVATTGKCDPADAEAAYRLARQLNAQLPKWAQNCWRWRIIYIRCELDAIRYRLASDHLEIGNEHGMKLTDWQELLLREPIAQADFQELIRLFHCSEKAMDDPYHGRVRPMCP